MKLIVNEEQLVNVGKNFSLAQANGKSIGVLRFQGDGPALFQQAMERLMRTPQALKQWYLSVIDDMAASWLCLDVFYSGSSVGRD